MNKTLIRCALWCGVGVFLAFAAYMVTQQQLQLHSTRNGGDVSNFAGGPVVMVLALIALGLYFLPTMIARQRQRKQRNAIVALNILLGWTFIGWVAALVWALIED
jgi:heme/copper-type cytochrome/quinol oxidase subunit 3